MMQMRNMLDAVRPCEDAVRDESFLVGPFYYLAVGVFRIAFRKKLRYDGLAITPRAAAVETARGGADDFVPG
jgi:hypothetical protein